MDRISHWLVLLPLLVLSQTLSASTYSPGGWPTLHYDAGNRRSVPVDVAELNYQSWTALAGASVLTAPVTSPDGQSLYVTTGMAKGHSNLHAFDIDGELLWQSAPWSDPDTGVDGCAILSSPIVDTEGDIYLSDRNQLFAFKPNGEIKWQIPLPELQPGDWVAAGDHLVNAFTTAAFTKAGHVLGVTNFGDVMVIDRETGKQLNEPYRLPAVLAPYSETVAMPDSLLGGNIMDPQLREWAWQLIFGGSMRSANTPAVSDDGRIYVIGSSATPAIGALYGLDLNEENNALIVKEAFITEIGIGSGSSPAL